MARNQLGRGQVGWSMENPVPDGRAGACSFAQKGIGFFIFIIINILRILWLLGEDRHR